MLSGRIGRYLRDAGSAFERAPAEVSIAVVLAVAFSYAVEAGGDAFRTWLEIAVAGAIAFAAAWTATLLRALGGVSPLQRWAITIGGAVLAAAYGLVFADFERAAEAWRAAMLLSAAVLWLSAVPVLARQWRGSVPVPDEAAPTATDRMRTVTGRILLRSLGAALYCGALYLGLVLAIAAVRTLFELELDGSVYGHVFGWIFIVLAPWIIVGGLDDYARAAAPRTDVGNVVRRMSAFLVPPLLALYYLILYAYAVRIGVTGEVPKNMVSPLVFAAGVLAALGLVLFDPRSREATAFRTLRAAPPLFLPLAALGLWAVSLRVSQYGWTEFRLLRLVLLAGMAALAVGATLQLLRRRRLALHFVPLGLAALLALGAIGPWSVQATARRSQQARLERALLEAGIDPAAPALTPPVTAGVPPGAGPPPRRRIPADVYDDLTGAARYLAMHFGVASLPAGLRAAVPTPRDAWAIGDRLGIEPDRLVDDARPPLAGHLPPGQPVRVGAVTMVRVHARTAERQVPGGPPTQAVQDSTRLIVTAAGERLTADLDSLAAALGATQREPTPDRRAGALAPPHVAVDVFDGSGTRRGSLLVLEVFMSFEEGRYRLQSLDAVLVLP